MKDNLTIFVPVVRFSQDAIVPTRSHTDDAGWDLYSPVSFCLRSKASMAIRVGIGIELHKGYVGLILPRSSMSKRDIHTFPGVIDAGFRGDIQVRLHNMSDADHLFMKGDRIAQICILELPDIQMMETKNFTNAKTDRGRGGFGSTGK